MNVCSLELNKQEAPVNPREQQSIGTASSSLVGTISFNKITWYLFQLLENATLLGLEVLKIGRRKSLRVQFTRNQIRDTIARHASKHDSGSLPHEPRGDDHGFAKHSMARDLVDCREGSPARQAKKEREKRRQRKYTRVEGRHGELNRILGLYKISILYEPRK